MPALTIRAIHCPLSMLNPRSWRSFHTMMVLIAAAFVVSFNIHQSSPLFVDQSQQQSQKFHDWKSTIQGSISNNTHTRAAESNSSSSFINPTMYPKLHNLVYKWKSSSISINDTIRELSAIIIAPVYKTHRPSQGIIFVKTHKTGSSTIASVLKSIATAHNLTAPVFYGPGERRRTWDVADKLDKAMQFYTTNPNIRGAPYDVWSDHSNYDNLLRERIVPSAEKILSIVRDPASRVRSSCDYFHCCPYDKGNASVWNEFVLSEGSTKSFKKEKRSNCKIERMSKHIVGNGMLKDGSTEQNLQEVIEAVKSKKYILLVMERMIESMLVLWYEYKLHPLDVAFISKKVRSRNIVPANRRDETTTKAENVIRMLNPNDTKLYEVANIQLNEYMGDVVFANSSSSTGELERAKDDLAALSNLVQEVCGRVNVMDNESEIFYSRGVAAPELEYWCSEKQLDGVKWHHVHMLILEGRSHWL